MSKLIIIGLVCANGLRLHTDDMDMTELALYSDSIAGGIPYEDEDDTPKVKKPVLPKKSMPIIKTEVTESATTTSSYELAADMDKAGLATKEMSKLEGTMTLGSDMSIQDQSAALA